MVLRASGILANAINKLRNYNFTFSSPISQTLQVKDFLNSNTEPSADDIFSCRESITALPLSVRRVCSWRKQSSVSLRSPIMKSSAYGVTL